MNFADMKSARQVSQGFYEMIEGYKRFKDSQVLLFTTEKSPLATLSDHDFLLDPNRIWRGVKIDITLPSEDLTKIPVHILKNVEFVSLISEDLIGDEPAPVDSIRRILKSTAKISHLQMDIRLLLRNLKDVFHCSAVRKNLKDLKYFEIVGFKEDHTIYQMNSLDLPDEDTFAKNLLMLANAGILTRLEGLRMPKMTFYGSRRRRLEKALFEVLLQNRLTLRELPIQLNVWNNEYDLRGIRFPRLNYMTVITQWRGQDSFRDFLRLHPWLEELDVTVQDEFQNSLLHDGIAVLNLKKLHLKSRWVLQSAPMVDWTFLRGMSQLKDFALVRPRPNRETYESGSELLKDLPRNQLERLSLRGFGAKERDCGFWRYAYLEHGNVFSMEPELPYKLELLSGFRNLKRLSFRQCPDAVDNDIMRFIVTEMTCLEELEVSHCRRLTDIGIAGKSKNGSDSIRNLKGKGILLEIRIVLCKNSWLIGRLKNVYLHMVVGLGLKELSIRRCPSVTARGLLSCLRLQFLRRLDYLAVFWVPKPIILGIVSQNPSLECLALNFKGDSKKVLKEIDNPRLKSLVNLVIIQSYLIS